MDKERKVDAGGGPRIARDSGSVRGFIEPESGPGPEGQILGCREAGLTAGAWPGRRTETAMMRPGWT